MVEAARDLLDEDGLPGFSMARLGDRLGVTAMALYRHIRDRSDLEDAVVGLVLDDMDVTDESGDGVATWMYRVRAHWLEHPWLGALLGSSSSLNPSWIAALDQLARALERAGLAGDDLARQLVLVSRVTCGIIFEEIAAPLPHSGELSGTLSPYAKSLRRYGNDALFHDLVADTVARIRRLESLSKQRPGRPQTA